MYIALLTLFFSKISVSSCCIFTLVLVINSFSGTSKVRNILMVMLMDASKIMINNSF